MEAATCALRAATLAAMTGDWRFGGDSAAVRSDRRADHLIARLAEANHGVVERSQLLALGLGRDQISYRLRVGRLHRIQPRVYAPGSRVLRREGECLAAVRSAGAGSALSHGTAAWLWGLRPPSRRIDLSSPRRLAPRRGVALHRRRLPDDELTEVDGIPVTGLARTLLDLAAAQGTAALERLLREAEFRRLDDSLSLAELVARHRGQPGTAIAAAALGRRRVVRRTRSELEVRFLEFLDQRGIPLPSTNALVRVDGRSYEVDCLWRRERVAVELDGVRAHGTERAFEADRERDLSLQAAGWAIGRVTWRQLHGAPDRLERGIRGLLGRRRARRRIAPAP